MVDTIPNVSEWEALPCQPPSDPDLLQKITLLARYHVSDVRLFSFFFQQKRDYPDYAFLYSENAPGVMYYSWLVFCNKMGWDTVTQGEAIIQYLQQLAEAKGNEEEYQVAKASYEKRKEEEEAARIQAEEELFQQQLAYKLTQQQLAQEAADTALRLEAQEQGKKKRKDNLTKEERLEFFTTFDLVDGHLGVETCRKFLKPLIQKKPDATCKAAIDKLRQLRSDTYRINLLYVLACMLYDTKSIEVTRAFQTHLLDIMKLALNDQTPHNITFAQTLIDDWQSENIISKKTLSEVQKLIDDKAEPKKKKSKVDTTQSDDSSSSSGSSQDSEKNRPPPPPADEGIVPPPPPSNDQQQYSYQHQQQGDAYYSQSMYPQYDTHNIQTQQQQQPYYQDPYNQGQQGYYPSHNLPVPPPPPPPLPPTQPQQQYQMAQGEQQGYSMYGTPPTTGYQQHGGGGYYPSNGYPSNVNEQFMNGYPSNVNEQFLPQQQLPQQQQLPPQQLLQQQYNLHPHIDPSTRRVPAPRDLQPRHLNDLQKHLAAAVPNKYGSLLPPQIKQQPRPQRVQVPPRVQLPPPRVQLPPQRRPASPEPDQMYSEPSPNPEPPPTYDSLPREPPPSYDSLPQEPPQSESPEYEPAPYNPQSTEYPEQTEPPQPSAPPSPKREPSSPLIQPQYTLPPWQDEPQQPEAGVCAAEEYNPLT